jgi:hypothetical protein
VQLTGKCTRQETAIGLTRLLTETPSLLEDPSRHPAFAKLLACIVELLEPAASHVSFGPEQATFVEETDALETLVRVPPAYVFYSSCRIVLSNTACRIAHPIIQLRSLNLHSRKIRIETHLQLLVIQKFSWAAHYLN